MAVGTRIFRLREHWMVALVLFLFVFLQVPFLMKFHFGSWRWDESVYIGIGKYIYSFGAAGLWEPIRPFGLPLVLGALDRLGAGMLHFELVSVLFAAGAVLVTYLIGRQIAGLRVSVLAASLLAFSSLFFANSTDVMTDIPSVFFPLLAVYFFMRSRLFFSGIFASAAFMFRFPHFLVAVCILIVILFSGRKDLRLRGSALFLAAFMLASAPFFIANYFLYIHSSSGFFDAALMTLKLASAHESNAVYAVSGFFGNALFYFSAIMKQNLFLLLFLPGLFFMLRKPDKKRLAIAACAVVYLAYFTVIPNKQERFLISFLPFIVIISSFWLSESAVFISRFSSFFKYAFFAAVAFVVAVGLWNSGRDIYEQYKLLPSEEPVIVTEFYRFFSSNNLTGSVLTTDPVFASFSDMHFVPYYDNPDAALVEYAKYHDKVDFIVYTPQFYPCEKLMEEKLREECKSKKDSLFKSIVADNRLVLNRTIDGRQYYIFST